MARARRPRPGVAPEAPRGVPFTIPTGSAELRDEPDGTTILWVNNVPSSPLRDDPLVLDFEYMRHAAAAIAAWAPPPRMLALHVGAAACALPRHLAHVYPDSGHIAVDIDTALPELVREWWDLPRAPRLRIRAQDGLEALESRRDDSLDLIVRDAFAGAWTPEHLTGDVWWQQARRAVRPGGLVVANVGARPGSDTSRDDALAAARAFGSVVAVAEPAMLKRRRRGNVIVVAGPVDTDALRRYAASAPLPTGVMEDWKG